MEVNDAQKYLHPLESHYVCRKCTNSGTRKWLPNSILTFDVEGRSNYVPLKNIEKNMAVGGKNYALAGCVERNNNHFIAHCLHPAGHFVKYDDLSPSMGCSDDNYLNCVLIVYYCQP